MALHFSKDQGVLSYLEFESVDSAKGEITKVQLRTYETSIEIANIFIIKWDYIHS